MRGENRSELETAPERIKIREVSDTETQIAKVIARISSAVVLEGRNGAGVVRKGGRSYDLREGEDVMWHKSPIETPRPRGTAA